MADTHNSIRVPLGPLNPVTWGPDRRCEPITIGVPIPAGKVYASDGIQLDAPFKLVTPAQARTLDTWPDGSIRWALVDFMVDAGLHRGEERPETDSASSGTRANLRVTATARAAQVETGVATFGFEVGGPFPFSSIAIADREPIDTGASGFRIDTGGRAVAFSVAEVRVHDAGPVRAEVELRAAASDPAAIDVSARVELFEIGRAHV